MSNKLTTEQFVKEAKNIHGDKYDYSLVDYINTEQKVKIICPIHGIFEQAPKKHKKGQGCPKCTKGRNSKTFEQFIKEVKLVHSDKYDYSLVNYEGCFNKVKIICPVHGVFEQTPHAHLNGQGCPRCGDEKKGRIYKKTTEQFVKEAKNIHGDKYDYSLTKYINNKTKVKVICPIHGVFEQIPSNHLNFNGCPHCKESHGEKEIRNFLIKNNISFESQKKFNDLKDKLQLSYDFYLPKNNLLIEFQGKQHYYKIKTWGGEKQFIIRKHHDWLKRKYAKDNNFNFLPISYKDYNIIENILKENIKND